MTAARLSPTLVHAVYGVLSVVVAAFACWLLAMPPAPSFASGTRGFSIVGPTTGAAGESVVLSVSGANVSLSRATVVVASTAGSSSFEVALDNGSAELALEQPLTRIAGLTTVWVIAGRAETSHQITFVASDAASPVVPLVGPKSIVADGEDHAMIVALPEDRFGNPAADAGSTVLSVRRPGGNLIQESTTSVGLVTWQRVFSATRAGRSEIAATTGRAFGPTADLDEVAGDPVPFTLSVAPGPLQADARSLHVVQTDQLVDRFGNLVTDGTAVEFLVDEPNGKGVATMMTMDGRATLHLQAPGVPGTLRLQAFAAGSASLVLELVFAPAVEEIPVLVQSTEGRWSLEVGPVLTTDAGFVPEGTVAVVTDGVVEHEVMLIGGRATLELAAPLSADSTIEILGVKQKVNP